MRKQRSPARPRRESAVDQFAISKTGLATLVARWYLAARVSSRFLSQLRGPMLATASRASQISLSETHAEYKDFSQSRTGPPLSEWLDRNRMPRRNHDRAIPHGARLALVARCPSNRADPVLSNSSPGRRSKGTTADRDRGRRSIRGGGRRRLRHSPRSRWIDSRRRTLRGDRVRQRAALCSARGR